MLRTERKINLSILERILKSSGDTELTEAPSQKGEIISFKIDNVTIASVQIGKPVSWSDLEGPCQTNLFWEDATSQVQAHKAHIITTASGDDEPKVLAWYLTKGIEALIQAVDSIGVYWGAGTLVSSKDMFIDMSKDSSLEYLPLYLWIDFRCLIDNNEQCSLFTTGLKSLGFMEIEIQDSIQSPSELVDKAFNFAHYLLDYGPIIKNGDAFGLSEDEKLYIQHSGSFVDPSQTVYRIEI